MRRRERTLPLTLALLIIVAATSSTAFVTPIGHQEQRNVTQDVQQPPKHQPPNERSGQAEPHKKHAEQKDNQGKGKCHIEHLGKTAFRFRCPDGSSGHVVPTSANHVFFVIRDRQGKETSMSLERKAGVITPSGPDLFLSKSCRGPLDDCRLQSYLSTLGPNDVAADWASKLSLLPSCPQRNDGNEATDCDFSDYNPCGLYGDICNSRIPIIGTIACAIRIGCDLGARGRHH